MQDRAALVAAGQELLKRNLTIETWGNLSLRNATTGHIYLTPSAMPYDTITEADIVEMDCRGTLLAGCRKPSIEAGLHLAIYQKRPEINAILHTHPQNSLVFACLGWSIPLLTDEAVQTLLAPVAVAPYGLPGSAELAAHCVAALGKEARACLLQQHGAVCLGTTLAAAFRTAAVLESTAALYYQVKTLGEPLTHTPGTIQALQKLAAQYGQNPPEPQQNLPEPQQNPPEPQQNPPEPQQHKGETTHV